MSYMRAALWHCNSLRKVACVDEGVHYTRACDGLQALQGSGADI